MFVNSNLEYNFNLVLHFIMHCDLLIVCLFIYLYLVYFFFFFQAEDGIRDIGVTGVQTCALPILPWRDQSPATARMFCDISMPDGSPSYADPRYVLKRALKRAADLGFTFYTHPEVEFFLFKDPLDPERPPEPVDHSGYFDHTPQSLGTDFRRKAITMLEQMGISVEFSHHEGGPGQQEIDLRYADALSTADNIMTFRVVVKEVEIGRASC